MFKMVRVRYIAVVISVLTCVNAEGRLSDLMARFKSNEETTKAPSGLDSLLDSYDLEREGTHKKSWMKLEGHHHRKSLSSLLDEFYPEVTTEGLSKEISEKKDSNFADEFDSVTTQGPFDMSPHRVHHQHSKDVKKGRHSHEGNHERRTTPGPTEPEQGDISGEGRKWLEETTVPTRHHHRYHRGDGLSPHQPQADSTFSQPSVSGYYDYSANGNGSPAVKNTRLSIADWRKMSKKQDKNKWTSTKSNTGDASSKTDLGRNSYGERRLVHQHMQLVNEMPCRLPQPKVIRIADHYPSASKMYFPTCTKLHQCAQDTGCCPANKRCGPKSTHRVELYFYSTYLTRPSDQQSNLQIEKLPFYNHTECECQDRSDEMPRDNDQITTNSVDSVYELETSGRQVCLCPSAFTLKFLPNGSCACDCFDKQKECTKYKRGKDFFNHKDKLCIAINKCVVPMCDYGTYNRRYGRCPRKHERHKSNWSKYN